ncbi:hypothetical protein ACH5RR_010630 [Cinchona calisaya]|uniref:Chlorophyllase n=1 Tax=Cinchona calisaya TaxID=153742 RepID=A0ABD3AJG7_9GENT
MAKVLEAKTTPTTSVFEQGNLSVKSFKVESSAVSSKCKPLFIVTPTTRGMYPVVQFQPGFMCLNTSYSQLLQHIASHGCIVVAPQIYRTICKSIPQEIKDSAEVTNWMATDLQSLLPENVTADFTKLGIAGHSRGGKVAFSLALGKAETTLKYTALMGIDPVAGVNAVFQTEPKILTYVPRSFNFNIPVVVIGTGLGSQQKNFFKPPCAPDGVNHAEFFSESKPPCCYFLAKDFGHMDMLDEGAARLGSCLCKKGTQPRDLMRTGIGGIVVAFMQAYRKEDDANLLAIVDDPKIAPITFDPVIYTPK